MSSSNWKIGQSCSKGFSECRNANCQVKLWGIVNTLSIFYVSHFRLCSSFSHFFSLHFLNYLTMTFGFSLLSRVCLWLHQIIPIVSLSTSIFPSKNNSSSIVLIPCKHFFLLYLKKNPLARTQTPQIRALIAYGYDSDLFRFIFAVSTKTTKWECEPTK